MNPIWYLRIRWGLKKLLQITKTKNNPNSALINRGILTLGFQKFQIFNPLEKRGDY